jgi:hypothetical protein
MIRLPATACFEALSSTCFEANPRQVAANPDGDLSLVTLRCLTLDSNCIDWPFFVLCVAKVSRADLTNARNVQSLGAEL